MATIRHQGPSPADLPAGDARREAQRAAADDLAERAETAGPDGGAIDPKALVIDSELAQHFNELEVTNADPAYEYCWVQAGFHGRFVKQKLTERVPESWGMAPVWEVVQGDMAEAPELRGNVGLDTTRRLGDVILMRARKDRYLKSKRVRDARRAAMFSGTTTELEELGRQYRHRGIIVHTNMGQEQLDLMGRRAAMRQQASQMVDGMLRDGSVPGLGAPGTR